MNSKIDGVIVKTVLRNEDGRGWLAEFFRQDELNSENYPVMAYVSMTKPGEIRGPHEHKLQSDLFGFVGTSAFDVYLWDNRPDSKTFKQKEKLLCEANNQVVLIIPPGVVHAYKNTGECDGFVFNAPNMLYKGANRAYPADEIRYENNPDSPFKLDD